MEYGHYSFRTLRQLWTSLSHRNSAKVNINETHYQLHHTTDYKVRSFSPTMQLLTLLYIEEDILCIFYGETRLDLKCLFNCCLWHNDTTVLFQTHRKTFLLSKHYSDQDLATCKHVLSGYMYIIPMHIHHPYGVAIRSIRLETIQLFSYRRE